MKFGSLLTLAFAGVSVAYRPGFVKTNGVQFELDGKPFPFAGTNAYWSALQANSSQVLEELKDVRDQGYKVLRFWAFGDIIVGQPEFAGTEIYFQSWNNSVPTINYGENGIQRIDQVVAAAEKYDIKVIITMTNNWNAYCGMDCYVNATSPGSPHDLFYRDPTIIAYYKSYVKALVDRYKDSPAVFSWELANEARCTGNTAVPVGDCNPSVITSWADEISTYIKSLDPDHMISVGGEGFFNWPNRPEYEYNGGSGQDYDAQLALENIDFGAIHTYPYGASQDVPWTVQWLKDHNTVSLKINKPSVIEEYGIVRGSQNPSRADFYNAWHNYTLESEAINGDMLWSFGDAAFVAWGGQPDDIYSIYPDDPDFKAFVTDWAKEMNAKPQTNKSNSTKNGVEQKRHGRNIKL